MNHDSFLHLYQGVVNSERQRPASGTLSAPMKLRAATFATALLCFVTLVMVFMGGLYYIGYFQDWEEADCQGYPVQGVASPSGRLRAEQEQEACRSTDQLRTRVTIAAPGQAEPVVAFIAMTGSALGSMATGQRSLPLTLRWESESRLVIVHPAGVASQLPAGPYGGVQVRLEAKAPAAK